jgi:hypothetical protein
MAFPASAEEVDRAILRTVVYAALFRYPLTLAQLHRSLMDVAVDLAALRQRLEGPFLRERIRVSRGFVHLAGCEEWVDLRAERERHTERLLARHRPMLRLLCRFPFVRLVALSGGCAHDNATDGDVDVFLVVKTGRAWAVVLTMMVLSKLAGVRRTLCLNYIVDEAALVLPEEDLFTAAEVVGMKPLAGRDAYRRFVAANAWVAQCYPNFFAGHAAATAELPETRFPRFLERLLELGPAPLVEAVSRRLLGAYLRRKANGHPGVVLSPHRLKLHLLDHRPGLTAAFDAAVNGAEETA